MSMSLNDMIGAIVSDFVEVHDYNQVITDKGVISLYNPVKCYLVGGGLIDFVNVPKNVSQPVITNVLLKSNNQLKFEISNKIFIEVSLKDSDYLGPEAVSIHFDIGEIIVI